MYFNNVSNDSKTELPVTKGFVFTQTQAPPGGYNFNSKVKRVLPPAPSTIPIPTFSIKEHVDRTAMQDEDLGSDSGWVYCSSNKEVSRKKVLENITTILRVNSVNSRMIDWKYLSQQKLSNTEIEAYKEFLDWHHVSSRISLDTARTFSQYVHWNVFEKHLQCFVSDAVKKIVHDAQNSDKQVFSIGIANYQCD